MQNRILSTLKLEFITRFLSFKYLPRWVVLAFDLFLIAFSCFVSIYIVERIGAFNYFSSQLPISLRVFILITFQVFFFWLFHTYSGVLRYSRYIDAFKLFFAISSNTLLLFVVNIISKFYYDIVIYDAYFLILYTIISFLLLFFLRLAVKLGFDFLSFYSSDAKPVFIYGTNNDSISIAKSLLSSRNESLRLVGFIDNKNDSFAKNLMGVKVYSFSKQNLKNITTNKSKKIIIPPDLLQSKDFKETLEVIISYGMTILTVPPIQEWDDSPKTPQIKSIQIEDLLERAEIKIDTDNIAKSILNNIILVSGAAGSIGSELVKQIVKFKPRAIILLDQSESPLFELTNYLKDNYGEMMIRFIDCIADVRNKERIEQVISSFRPDIIFHAAAYKHVPMMEAHPNEGVQVNIKGTKNMADLALKYKVKRFVMVSTDKAVNPTNVMGATKRIAEIYVQSLNSKIHKNEVSNEYKTKFITTRFGNVLGSNGSVIPTFKKQIEKGGPITVTHPDIIRYFMTIPEASLLVLEAGAMGKGGEIYIFDMGKPVRIYDMAKKMICLAGFKPEVDIQIEFTGLRPGEKLYEELLNDKEITLKTDNKKIMIATVREYEYDTISLEIDKLIDLSYTNKDFLIVSQMKKIVPEYKSKNSQFEKLD